MQPQERIIIRGRKQGGCHDRQGSFARQARECGTIEPTAVLAAAVNVLAERRIGAVVILGADHRIVGILSERDIVHALAEHGPTALHRTVGQFMTRDVKTCSENDTIESLMGRMTTGKFRHMPVVEQGKLVGIVSIGDVVKNRVEEIEREAAALRDYIQHS
jgi:CBS domain-containing protein